jgi:hypothetical protein
VCIGGSFRISHTKPIFRRRIRVRAGVTRARVEELNQAQEFTHKDKLEGRDTAIFAGRDRKLEAARAQRKARRQAARKEVLEPIPCELQHVVAN